MLFYFLVCIPLFLFAKDPFPIGFSIPESKIIDHIPEKEWDFAPLVPGDLSTYIYDDEEAYYKDYQRSYFALTKIKAGADCMRHYEILANGCIPYFEDLERVHPKTMTHFPKELVLEAMSLPGVGYRTIDHTKFDKKRYLEILEKLLAHTRKHLTCRSMAQYVLYCMGCPNPKKVVYLSLDQMADYLRCTTYIGFKQLLKERCIVYPRINRLYKDSQMPMHLDYGKGFTISRILSLQEEKILGSLHKLNQECPIDLVVVGSVHRFPLGWIKYLEKNKFKVAYICGEDFHVCPFHSFQTLFIREYSSLGI